MFVNKDMKEEKNIKIALKKFFTNEYNKLIYYVHGYLSEVYYGVDAEDIIQDVALNIFSKADINAPIENLAAYIYRAVRNRIIDIQRKHRKSTSIESFNNKINENVIMETISDVVEEEEFYKNEELQRRMVNAVEQLKSEEKAVIIETEFNDKSFNELSEVWDIPVGTLLARKHRALGKLHKTLYNEKKKYNL